MDVWVVTGLELGWDCVVGVFSRDEIGKAELLKSFPEDAYVISEHSVEIDLSNWD